MRLNHLQDKCAGGGGIKCVAAAFEHAHRRLRRQPVRGGGNTEGANDLGAGGEHEVMTFKVPGFPDVNVCSAF